MIITLDTDGQRCRLLVGGETFHGTLRDCLTKAAEVDDEFGNQVCDAAGDIIGLDDIAEKLADVRQRVAETTRQLNGVRHAADRASQG